MTSRLSFAELKAAYGSRNKPLPLIAHPDTTLPQGKSILDVLQKLHFTREKGMLPDNEISRGKVVAICLVIVDKLHHEDIWRAWIEEADRDPSNPYKARLFIHAKFPERVESIWVKERTLQISFRPEWNSIEVVQAMLALLEEATTFHSSSSTKEFSCERCIFGTETCIPIRNVKEIGQILFETPDGTQRDKSWLNVYNTPKSSWEAANCFRAIDSDIIPRAAIHKSLPGWIMLTRRHAKEILSLVGRFGDWKQNAVLFKECKEVEVGDRASGLIGNPIIRAFGTGGTFDRAERCAFAPEEMFFPTMLAILGYLRPNGTTDEVFRCSAVFAEWKRAGDANPIAYPQLSPSLLEKFRDTGALLARKFAPGTVSLNCWKEVLNSHQNQNEKERGKRTIGESSEHGGEIREMEVKRSRNS